MRNLNMNNVILEHRGHEISIAQHKISGKVEVQELMVSGPFVEDFIIPYGSRLEALMGALREAITVIDQAIQEAV